MHWLTIDPGETTGWALWKGVRLVHADQWPRLEHIDLVDGWLNEPPSLLKVANEVLPLGAIVCENWQLYPDVMRTGALDYDECRTARAIGAYELLARQHNIKFITQGAAIKGPAEEAGSRELYLSPQHEMRHANDA
ncbi:hypothetical protein, partial [uncultured Phenylobacterium sp.]|uniref:hypothetical protein n=1 Tax=uncultured Phenylobacterium sp. TaxID=349273 RepID=UPI0025F77346